MNSVFLKYICFLILLFCIGCNPATYEHYQKKEIEDIGISFPASAKCFFSQTVVENVLQFIKNGSCVPTLHLFLKKN